MNRPLTRIPTQISVRLEELKAPTGRTWNTRDCTNCSSRVAPMTSTMLATRSKGRLWMMYLHTQRPTHTRGDIHTAHTGTMQVQPSSHSTRRLQARNPTGTPPH
jgi:hypothetical protein